VWFVAPIGKQLSNTLLLRWGYRGAASTVLWGGCNWGGESQPGAQKAIPHWTKSIRQKKMLVWSLGEKKVSNSLSPLSLKLSFLLFKLLHHGCFFSTSYQIVAPSGQFASGTHISLLS